MESHIICQDLGLTQGKAKELFDHVCVGMPNWKCEISYSVNIEVGQKMIDSIIVAIEWFVGGNCTVKYLGLGRLRITNAGYYVNIGA
jgi:hypothetical protein